MKRLTMIGCAFAGALASTFTLPAAADETNPYIVHRQGTYKTISGHMDSLKAMLFLNHEAQGQAAYHAEAIVEAYKHMGNAYPAGSDKGKTKARAEIWSQPEKFREAGRNSFAAATALAEATQMGDQKEVVEAFKKLGSTCKACHDDFRKK